MVSSSSGRARSFAARVARKKARYRRNTSVVDPAGCVDSGKGTGSGNGTGSGTGALTRPSVGHSVGRGRPEGRQDPLDDPLRPLEQFLPGDVNHLVARLADQPVPLELPDRHLAGVVLHQAVGLRDGLAVTPKEVDLVLVELIHDDDVALGVDLHAADDLGLQLWRRETERVE